MMHDGMPYDPIGDQGQGHDPKSPLNRSRPSVPHGTNFDVMCLVAVRFCLLVPAK